MDYTIIKKYLNGTASEADAKKLFQWVESTPENRQDFIQIKKLWALTATSNTDENKAWQNIIKETNLVKRKTLVWVKYVKYAAMILVFFSLGMTLQYLLLSDRTPESFQYLSDTSIEVPLGQMTTVVLPDGTNVQLNSGSKLYYSGDFNSGQRVVSLKGEAFFDVAKDKEHPFLVQTHSLNFKVYGTSFNIQAYPDEAEVNTTLVEGSLGILNKKGNELTRLVPGENAKFKAETNDLIINEVNTNLYTSWKDGIITFRNVKLSEIANQIERWYNVEIVFRNSRIGNEEYMGTIMRNKPIDQILEVFSLTSSLKYEIIPRAEKPTLIYWE